MYCSNCTVLLLGAADGEDLADAGLDDPAAGMNCPCLAPRFLTGQSCARHLLTAHKCTCTAWLCLPPTPLYQRQATDKQTNPPLHTHTHVNPPPLPSHSCLQAAPRKMRRAAAAYLACCPCCVPSQHSTPTTPQALMRSWLPHPPLTHRPQQDSTWPHPLGGLWRRCCCGWRARRSLPRRVLAVNLSDLLICHTLCGLL
jgi:hypothetical protein